MKIPRRPRHNREIWLSPGDVLVHRRGRALHRGDPDQAPFTVIRVKHINEWTGIFLAVVVDSAGSVVQLTVPYDIRLANLNIVVRGAEVLDGRG